MASQKKRRKLSNLARKAKAGRGGVHPDGDRRRRGAMRVEDAIALKRAMQQFPGVILPDDPTQARE